MDKILYLSLFLTILPLYSEANDNLEAKYLFWGYDEMFAKEMGKDNSTIMLCVIYNKRYGNIVLGSMTPYSLEWRIGNEAKVIVFDGYSLETDKPIKVNAGKFITVRVAIPLKEMKPWKGTLPKLRMSFTPETSKDIVIFAEPLDPLNAPLLRNDASVSGIPGMDEFYGT